MERKSGEDALYEIIELSPHTVEERQSRESALRAVVNNLGNLEMDDRRSQNGIGEKVFTVREKIILVADYVACPERGAYAKLR